MSNKLKVPARQHGSAAEARLKRNRKTYKYVAEKDNRLRPLCVAESWPWLQEQYGPSWLVPFALTRYLPAQFKRRVKLSRFLLQRLTFRFDKLRAYRQLFAGSPPEFVDGADRDDYFAWRRIAGPNALSIRQERDVHTLRTKIAFDVARVEQRLTRRMGKPVSLEEEARAGRLFACDYRLLQWALRANLQNVPRDGLSEKVRKRLSDSRWREKYLPAPIGVFLELPGFYEKVELVPLAIQIDQPGSVNQAIYYPDDANNWGWKIAKLYFETADENFHVGCGHVLRTHLVMNPFCMATPRQLPRDHCVFRLLRPHTRFTLATNKAVYDYYQDRKRTYADFYGGKLDEYRRFSILNRAGSFVELSLLNELESRGVSKSPRIYPYRDDAKLWLKPIRAFVARYLYAFYEDDTAVKYDAPLQVWKREICSEGGMTGLVPGDSLDTRKKLVDLLAQVLFIAGPGHASQHFSEMYYYRYPPAFVGSAYAPPPRWAHEADSERWLRTLPAIRQAARQFAYSTFGNFQYDTFGDYRRYPLGWMREAQDPIRKLNEALEVVESTIRDRVADRPLPYDFLLPSRVPNSINI